MINIGLFPAGKSITVTFDATVDNPLDATNTQVCNQGTVTADGPISVLTDDPSVGGPADPTCTPLDQPDVTVAVVAYLGPGGRTLTTSSTVLRVKGQRQRPDSQFQRGRHRLFEHGLRCDRSRDF